MMASTVKTQARKMNKNSLIVKGNNSSKGWNTVELDRMIER